MNLIEEMARLRTEDLLRESQLDRLASEARRARGPVRLRVAGPWKRIGRAVAQAEIPPLPRREAS
jgi:hypothetical protein